MKYLITAIALLSLTNSCRQIDHSQIENQNKSETLEKQKDINSETLSNFPVIGFKKTHEEIIPFPVKRVFPLFEPQGRFLLYDNWKPIVLKEGIDGSIIGRIEFSKYDQLDVLLKVTKHNPEKGHIQYLAIWDDFEIQKIDIFCKPGKDKNTTDFKWVEHNAGLYEKGVSLVSMFVKEGHLVQAVERYTDNIEKKLNKDQ